MRFFKFFENVFKQKVSIIKFAIMVMLMFAGSYSWVYPLNLHMEGIRDKKIYLVVSIIFGSLFFVFYIIDLIKKGRQNKKIYFDIAYFSPIMAMEIIAILICINSQLWGLEKHIIGFVGF